MYWPDTQTGVDVEPARKPVASAVRKFFSEGGAGQPPTVPGGDWFNQVTNELLSVVEAAGLTPSKTEDNQVLSALTKLLSFGINPDAIPGNLDDHSRIQAALDMWSADKSLPILLGREYDVTGDPFFVSNVETEVPENQLLFFGGTLKKSNAGFMFQKPPTQTQPTGGIRFLATRFIGSSPETYIVDGHNDFGSEPSSSGIIRVSFSSCFGYGIQVAHAREDGYLQSISLDSSTVWRRWSGYMFDCGYFFDVTFDSFRFEQGDAVIVTRHPDADPASNALKASCGNIEGLSGVSGPAVAIGGSYASALRDVYFEQNAGGDLDFSVGTSFHKGISIQGCGFQPTAAQLADPNYYPVKLGKGAVGAFNLGGNSSTGNLYSCSLGNQAPIFDHSSWAAGTLFGPNCLRRFSLGPLGFHGQVFDGAGGGLDYASGLFYVDNHTDSNGNKTYIGWGDQSPASGGFSGIKFARGSVIYNTSAGVQDRQYGVGTVHSALIMGWQCVSASSPGTPTGTWVEMALMLPY